MPDNSFGIRGIADQRYYHFVLLRDAGGFNLNAYWRHLGDIIQPARPAGFSAGKFQLQHRKLRSAKPFARGVVSDLLSEKGNGRPPYLYDLFAARIELRDVAYCMLAFPFIALAKDIVGECIADQRLLRGSEFIGVDVPKLVGVMESGSQGHFEELTTRVVNLEFVVTDDKALTAVRLGGDDPLSAEVYVNFLRSRVSKGFVRPSLCVLACEKEWPSGDDNEKDERRRYRSRLRVDGNGNFRFYAHLNCSNMRLIPYAIGQLRSVPCLRKVMDNPLSRSVAEEE